MEPDERSPEGDGFEKYILPYGVDPKDLFSTALSIRDISALFKRIKAERLIFLADTCLSGTGEGKIPAISDKFWQRLSRDKNRMVIAAGGAKEINQRQYGLKQGAFTYYLLEGLWGKADLDRDGFIFEDEAYRYVYKKVRSATNQQQNPVKSGEVTGEIILGRVK